MTQTTSWHSPPAQLDLSSDLVQIWQVQLNSQPVEVLRGWLSPDECQRADRFVRPIDRHSFIAARGILRSLLGGYLHQPPESIEFGYAERGKPFLAGDSHSLEFNLSHAGGIALYAFARHRRVGIDVESFRELDILPLAERFFSDREYRQLCNYPPEAQPAAFFSLWTAKEALLKATGEGLLGLSGVEIALDTDNLIPSIAMMTSSTSAWYLQSLEVGTGYQGAVAIEGERCPIDCYWYRSKVSSSSG